MDSPKNFYTGRYVASVKYGFQLDSKLNFVTFSILPNRIIPFKHWKALKEVSKIENDSERRTKISNVINTLPEFNQQILGHLILHLKRYTSNS